MATKILLVEPLQSDIVGADRSNEVADRRSVMEGR